MAIAGGCGGGGDDYQVPPSPDGGGGGDAAHDASPTDGGTDASTTEADLSVAITAAPSPVAANASLAYSIIVTNHGGLSAMGVTVTQNLPSGDVAFVSATGIGWTCAAAGQIVTCTRTSLIVGDAPTITVDVTTPSTGGTLTSSVDVTSHTADTNQANNSATATTTVLTPADLSIAISDTPDPVPASGNVTYTITVTDVGPGMSTGLSVTDAVPTGATFVSASGTGWSCAAALGVVTCTNPSLDNGASAVITLVLTAPSSGGTLANSATISAMTPDPVSANNTASTNTTVNAAGDLSVAVSGSPDPVLVNGTVTYAIDVNNAGPDSASGITVTDQLPGGNVAFVDASGAGWTCTAAGQVVTCTRAALLVGAAPTITIHITAPPTPTSLTDTVTVTSASSDPNTANDTASTTTTVAPAADVSIAVVDSPDPVSTSGTLTYSLNVQNAGPSPATSLTVVDTLPAGTTFQSVIGTNWTCPAPTGQTVTCTSATLAAGTSAPSISLVVTAPSSPTTITNTASVSAATTDPVPGNNTASATTTVNAPADLVLVLADSPDPVAAQSTLTYTIDITNNGPADANNLVVTNRLPDGNVSFLSATGIGWACNLAGQIVTCTRPLLIAGVAPTITIKITTPASFTTLVDTANVTSDTADSNPANNSQTQSTNGATPLADLSVTLTDTPDPVTPDSNQFCGTGNAGCVLYVAKVTNAGPSIATGVNVVFTIPISGSFQSVIGSGWVCPAPVGGQITCTLTNSLAVGATTTEIDFDWKAPFPGGFSIVTTANVNSTSTDPNSANNTVSNDTTVLP